MAPLVLLVARKSAKIAEDILKRFAVNEINFFWKRMIIAVNDLTVVRMKLQQWFESIISYAANHIREREVVQKKRLLSKEKAKAYATIPLSFYDQSFRVKGSLHSKLLRVTLHVMARMKMKMEFSVMQEKSYSDQKNAVRYKLSPEDELKTKEFASMKEFLLTVRDRQIKDDC